ncbi:MAG: class IV adenylate cyclase [Isosphaeraceae bacterium]|nr:class IV adenylate cyclase [Isosphaeraceae bacterium]
MDYEVEIKFRVADHRDVRHRLEDLGAQAGLPIGQEDIYLAHPARDFRQTDEALRLRRDGAGNRITYKGPKKGGPTKTREEIEVPFADGEDAFARMARLLERLGFRPVATIRKSRSPFHLDYHGRAVEVVLDLAEGLGAFAEVETLAAGDDDLPVAQRTVLALAEALGLTEVEPRSYLRMTLERSGG